MTWYRSEEGWSWHANPSVNLGSSGPVRVDTSAPDPDYKPRPVGFTARLEREEHQDRQGDPEPIEDVIARVPGHVAALTGPCGECGDTDGYHFRSCPTQQRNTE